MLQSRSGSAKEMEFQMNTDNFDITCEFPLQHQEIAALKVNNIHFNKLCQQYLDVVSKLHYSDTPSKSGVETLEVMRIIIKSELSFLLQKRT